MAISARQLHPRLVYKARRVIGNPVADIKPSPQFEPLPLRTNADLVLPLGAIAPDVVQAATAAGRFVFHSVGDTGGVHGTDAQGAVAAAMEDQIRNAPDNDRPRLFYQLGDVVYYNGLSSDYPQQFYEPYQYYPADIVAIPGNHDGATRVQTGDPPDNEPSLYGFMRNFCSPVARHESPYRLTMTQPYCYWTLAAPFAYIIGLYSNIDGQLDGRGAVQQQSWLVQQLAAIPADKWAIVAVHHPCYSLDATHGGYPEILAALDQAFAQARRWPDAVLSGHVHNYQRFSRQVAGHGTIPYIVAGGGGYANTPKLIHQMQRGGDFSTLPYQTTLNDVKLEAWNTANPNFLRVTIEPRALTFDCFSVPFDAQQPATNIDTVVVRTRTRKTP